MSDLGGDPRRASVGKRPVVSGEEQVVVGNLARGVSPAVIGGIFAVLAIALFLFLNARRTAQVASVITPNSGTPVSAAPPPPLELTPRPVVPVPAAVPPPAPLAAIVPPLPPDDTIQRLHAPTVVVDLQAGHASAVPVPAAPAGGPVAAAAQGAETSVAAKLAPPESADQSSSSGAVNGALAGAAAAGSPLLTGAIGGSALSPNEQFAARASDALPEPAIATQMANLGTTITQGATIPAVLETAINSDLPGYTRAVVSRDVLGFDGKNVLIPRGSRLIGQYRNALSLGQSRVFVIWTRVIRPDGVTVQIGSPGDDSLGRGGLTGEVNTHFFARFGGAILLSVLNAGVAAVAGTPTTQISIGSPAAAAGAAASATVPTSSDILPTIKVKQGADINIFVARDLDFSGVNPVK